MKTERLFDPPAGRRTVWYSPENVEAKKGAAGQTNFGRKGQPVVWVKPGESVTLMDYRGGSGILRRIWMTMGNTLALSSRALRECVIEMYWDGADTPAVRAPLGDFFGMGGGRKIAFENALFSSPEGRSFCCVIPMPFRTGARVVLINETDLEDAIYYDINCTLGDDTADALYFHAFWRRENPTRLREDFELLPRVEGCGRFLGTLVSLRENPAANTFWFGEGEVKMYLDGDEAYPSLCGTGTEDYYTTAWGPSQPFVHRDAGCMITQGGLLHTFFRYHISDPIFFDRDFRAVYQTLGGATYGQLVECMDRTPGLRFMKPGAGDTYYTREELAAQYPAASTKVERSDDIAAVAYFYLDTPEDNLGALAPVDQRRADLV